MTRTMILPILFHGSFINIFLHRWLTTDPAALTWELFQAKKNKVTREEKDKPKGGPQAHPSCCIVVPGELVKHGSHNYKETSTTFEMKRLRMAIKMAVPSQQGTGPPAG